MWVLKVTCLIETRNSLTRSSLPIPHPRLQELQRAGFGIEVYAATLTTIQCRLDKLRREKMAGAMRIPGSC